MMTMTTRMVLRYHREQTVLMYHMEQAALMYRVEQVALMYRVEQVALMCCHMEHARLMYYTNHMMHRLLQGLLLLAQTRSRPWVAVDAKGTENVLRGSRALPWILSLLPFLFFALLHLPGTGVGAAEIDLAGP